MFQEVGICYQAILQFTFIFSYPIYLLKPRRKPRKKNMGKAAQYKDNIFIGRKYHKREKHTEYN